MAGNSHTAADGIGSRVPDLQQQQPSRTETPPSVAPAGARKRVSRVLRH